MKQIEKNMKTLWEEIERLCNQPVTEESAEKINVYMGALRGICMIYGDNDKMVENAAVRNYSEEKPAPTPELDGDTEFERVLMTIPSDVSHMTKIAYIFNRHLEDLKFENIRAYNVIMKQLRDVANS